MLIEKTSIGDLRQYSFNAFRVSVIWFWQLSFKSAPQIWELKFDGNILTEHTVRFLFFVIIELIGEGLYWCEQLLLKILWQVLFGVDEFTRFFSSDLRQKTTTETAHFKLHSKRARRTDLLKLCFLKNPGYVSSSGRAQPQSSWVDNINIRFGHHSLCL